MPGVFFEFRLPHRIKRCHYPEPVMTDTHKCPICGEPNQCSLSNPATATQACWCFTAEIAPEARERIPRDAQNKACICSRCARGELPTKA